MASIDIIGSDGRRLPARDPRTGKATKAPKGARYRVRYRTPGGASRTKTFDRKVDATSFIASTEHSRSSGTFIDPSAGRERFVAFARRWADGQDWKRTTAESFAPHLRRLERILGDVELAGIDKPALQSTRTQLLRSGYARSTATITLHYATSIMRAAYHAGLVPRDPTVGVKPPKRRTGDPDGRVGPENVPTRAEVLAILAAAPSPYRASIALGIAGLRVSEMLAVTADRLDLDEGTLAIDRQLQRIDGVLQFTGPKGEKERTIELPSVALLELRRHLRDHQAEGLLFRTVRTHEMLRRAQFYSSAWRPALVGAGLDRDRFVFHSLRHFAASSMLAEGAPLTAVAGHLGDTVETISKVYLHWLRDDRHVPAAVLDRLLADESNVAQSAAT